MTRLKIVPDLSWLMTRSAFVKMVPLTCEVKWRDQPLLTGSVRVALESVIHVLEYVRQFEPSIKLSDYIFCDDCGPSWRKSVYPKYKIKRKKDEETQRILGDMFEMKRVFICIMGALGVATWHKPELEGDDVIAFVTKSRSKKKLKSLIYSTDLDLAQLINSYTSMIKSVDDGLTTYGMKNLPWIKRVKIGKEQKCLDFQCGGDVVLYKALCGDSSDGYSGVIGFGNVKWLKLIKIIHNDPKINSIGFLKKPIAACRYLESKHPELKNEFSKILEGIEQFNLCKKLAVLKPEIPIKSELWYRDPNVEKREDGGLGVVKKYIEFGNESQLEMIFNDFGMVNTYREFKNQVELNW